MKIRLFRRGVPVLWIVAALTVAVVYICYTYASLATKLSHTIRSSVLDQFKQNEVKLTPDEENFVGNEENLWGFSDESSEELLGNIENNFCSILNETEADINTRELYSKFDFSPSWMKNKGIWNDKFEKKYLDTMKKRDRPPLHVIVLPHSHNDPGWLRSFEGYFTQSTKNILNSLVEKLPQLKNMTFIWTEISFLNLWWEQATQQQQETFRSLVHEGRVEITTGGWVMTDEAAAHIYAMADQLIEGHQWVQENLNVTPTSSWSIDPFGHGSTMPHLLGGNGYKGAIIQRIHYNWKEFLASNQYGDFIWRPLWESVHSNRQSLLVHNMPFDMYFVDSSCGPHIDKCKPYDFRWFGNIKDTELQAKADQLIEEYSRSASLYPHNVFLAIVGGDFRYDYGREFDQQYNYMKLINYVNANSVRYNNARMQFGTPKDYFEIVKQRSEDMLPTLAGDFFPYGDIFTSGKPQYWTGYFTTRPFLKILCRDLEHNLRNSEILFTLAFNRLEQKRCEECGKYLRESYEKLIMARRNLALFQHHDAITGTSKSYVMKNYLDRMYKSIVDLDALQQASVEALIQPNIDDFKKDFLTNSFIRNSSEEIPARLMINFDKVSSTEVVLFNSLGQERIEIVTLRISSPNVYVTNSEGKRIRHQVNYVFNDKSEKLSDEFEVIFMAKLEALSLSTYKVIYDKNSKSIATVEMFKNSKIKDFSIESPRMKLTFDGKTGFLKQVDSSTSNMPVHITFGAYRSSIANSGAYLFKPNETDPYMDIFEHDKFSDVILMQGSIASYAIMVYGSLLISSYRIFNTNTHLDSSIYMENKVSFDKRHTNAEMFMRIQTSVKNDETFHTDLNNFQWVKRQRVSSIGIDGNYYPITSSVFIQDDSVRVSLVTNHAQGATSGEEGALEVMLDRRTPTDDHRGLDEGVTDNLPTKQSYWISFENFSRSKLKPTTVYTPSIHVHHLINVLSYPVNVFLIDAKTTIEINRRVNLLTQPLPCDLHLFNLRTVTSGESKFLPSHSSLLILRRYNFDCFLISSEDPFYVKNCATNGDNFENIQLFGDIKIDRVEQTSLTAVKSMGEIAKFNKNLIDVMELKTFKINFFK